MLISSPVNQDEVVQSAAQNGSGDPSMFSHAMQHVQSQTQEHEEPIDEEHVTNAHKQAYENGNAGSLSAGSMGSAAALQVRIPLHHLDLLLIL